MWWLLLKGLIITILRTDRCCIGLLLFACRVILLVHLSFADFFSKLTFLKKFSRIPSVSKSLDPDQVQDFVWPYLQGSNCLQKFSPDDTSR